MKQDYFTEFCEFFSHPLKSHVNRKSKLKLKKKLTLSLYKIFQGFQNCLRFYSSIKTKGGVVFYIYIYIWYNYIIIKIAFSEKKKSLNGHIYTNKKSLFLNFTCCVEISEFKNKRKLKIYKWPTQCFLF